MLGKRTIFGTGAKAIAVIAMILASAGTLGMASFTAIAAPACENLAITGASASGYETVNPPANAIDNSAGTRWSNQGYGSWIRADLGQQRIVCSIDVVWYKGDSRANTFAIAVSSDGTSYTNVYSGKSSGTTTAAERYSFAETSARYVRVTVTDVTNGNSQWVSISEIDVNGYTPVADTTAPAVAITSPAGGSTVNSAISTITIQGTSSDNTAVRIVEVRIDSGAYVAATPRALGDWSTWSVSMPITSGSHRIVPRATDNAGNQAWNSITVTVVIDSTAPAVAITSPAGGSTVTVDSVSVQGTSSDSESGVSDVQVRLDNGQYALAVPRALGDWSTWTAPLNLLDGQHTIQAKATDRAGNFRESSVIVTADTTPPVIAITEPADNAALTSGTIAVAGTSTDSGGVKTVEVRVDGGAYSPATLTASGWSATVTTTTGSHSITARATDNAGNQATDSINVSVTIPSSSTLDKFGIEKVYPTAEGGNEWYVNMDDPKSDPNFRNLPSMTKQPDGSWQVSASQVRMEAWSPSGEKWLNVEITGYAKMVSGSNELIQWYSRGGHHTSSNECLGSAYKARLYGDGEARWVKEVTHPAYTSNRGSMQATDTPLADRWIGFKAVIYNFVENGKTYVRMESYIDDDVTGSDGSLVIDNNWQLASVVEDRGGWSTSNPDFDPTCTPLNKDSTEQYRQRGEILNLPGGTSTQNIGAWRSDGLTWNWKYLSVREIQAP